MARQLKHPYHLPKFDSPNIEQSKVLAVLQKMSDAINPNESSLVGYLWSTPVADSYALYLVAKDKPLTLQHIPYGDAWEAPKALLRGLREADIRLDLQRTNTKP